MKQIDPSNYTTHLFYQTHLNFIGNIIILTTYLTNIPWVL